MSQLEPSPYLQRLLDIYDEKRKRFQWSFSLLLTITIIFFFFLLVPYMTLLGNRADCLALDQCTPAETSILDERFNEVTTSWGNIPISTAEVVILFPLLTAVGLAATSAQLIGLMRLRKAIQKQIVGLDIAPDLTLITPLLLDPERGFLDVVIGSIALAIPGVVGIFSINLIYVQMDALRENLPYAQSRVFYDQIYLLSIFLILLSLVRVGFQFFQNQRKR